MRDEQISRIAVYGPFAGTVPFALGLLLVLAPGLVPLEPVVVERALIGYGALLLGFFGGVRWGLAIMDRRTDDTVFAISLLGAGLGLVALVLPFGFGLALLTVGFAGQGAWDVWAGQRRSIPEAYASGRAGVTLIICLLLAATILAYAATHG
ncbi:MAG: DUF3429 domain-containing protein [Alphaproteobacteria bacterium]|nr:DUF3429 domain-containing protein [Alphaproteobacteria bacterium]